jgi:hypothetical protein
LGEVRGRRPLGGRAKRRSPRGSVILSFDTEHEPRRGGALTYLRCTIGRWTIALDSEEGREAFRLIDTEGVRVFRQQPGFIRSRLLVADPVTTIAVAEWESEELGKPGRGATGSG